ncbi:MAG: hypothetical protein BMS9Abin07_2133 [Acidimicrobiia bacterium]|nr:MAG: hypothetical protein BMS9Abin07_2133 [Acidimicrobiia bacterium]
MTAQEVRSRIDDRILIRGGKLLAGTAVAVTVLSLGIIVGQGEWHLLPDTGAAHVSLWAIGIGSLAWVAIGPQPRNGVVWTLAFAAFFAALAIAGFAAFSLVAPTALVELPFDDIIDFSPSALPVAAATALIPAVWAWFPAFFLVLTFGLLLFPDGHPPSPRWRWVGWLSAVIMVLIVPTLVWLVRPWSTTPFRVGPEGATNVLPVLAAISVVASVVAIVVRYRRSSGVTRHQIRWIAWGGAFLAASMFVIIVNEDTTTNLLVAIAEAVVILSFWVAITKYRLYDIDVVISKTVTYGALAIVITALYVAIVVGIGTLVGQGGEPNLALAIAATAAVALLFEPIRSRLQRWANRLVFGERATPYEVLARFSKRAASAEGDQEMLERIPRLIVDGTGASEATLWIADEDGLEPAAWWPERESASTPPRAMANGPWSDPAADYSVAVEHDGELLGGLSLVAGRGETIAPAEEELVQNLAGGLGLALRNARLTDDLRDQVGELAASRERILSAADAARRGLEQDLDMGPQQELVAVKVKLGVVKSQAETANAPKTAAVLAQLEQDTGTAIESVRDFARGVYPPLLEAEGLAVAISAEGAKSALPVAIQARDVGRYPREVETAVFFSILESLQNAAKYSNAASATVRLEDDGDWLRFSVSDDGLGFDPSAVDGGSGIPGMTDRLDAAGGTLKIESAPGNGTSVAGSVPI